MNARFKPCMDILPAAQQALWPMLCRAPELGLVLYGGTAIALRLGHRASVDFDFFTDQPLDWEALQAAFPFVAAATVLQERPNARTLLTAPAADGMPVKVSFFGGIGFGRVGVPDLTEDGTLYVASLDDLMATKLKVLLQRVEAKDYLDIAALLQANVSLARGLASARTLFGPNFQPGESLKAMVYFDGGDLVTLPPPVRNILIDAAASVRDLPQVDVLSPMLAPTGFKG